MNGVIRIGTELETKKFDQQIAQLERKLKQQQKQLSVLLQVQAKKPKAGLEKGIEDLRASIEKTENSIISLNEKKRELENDGKSSKLKEGFESAFKSAKRLVLGIIGIRAAYSLIRKATSAYLADNEETTSKIESLWSGLGVILGPVIETIVNLLKKAVTAILYFMSVLTGVNYVAKANAVVLKKQAKATNDLTKATQKYTASFDEMNIASENSAIGGAGTDNIAASLFDINELGENVRTAIEKIATALKPVYEILKNIVGFALEHPEIIMGMLGGAALLSFLGKVIGLAGAGTVVGTGLAGILGVLLAIASVGIVAGSALDIIKNGVDYLKLDEDTNELLDSVDEKTDELTDKTIELAHSNDTTAESVKDLNKSYKQQIKNNLDLVDLYDDETSAIDDGILGFLGLKRAISGTFGPYNRHHKQVKQSIDQAYDMINSQIEMYKSGKLTEEGVGDLTDEMIMFINQVGKGGTSVEELSEQFDLNEENAKNLKQQYDYIALELMRMYVNGNLTSDALNGIPENVKTKIDSNADDVLKVVDELNENIINLIPFKKVEIETEISVDDNKAKNTLNNLFSNLASITDNVFGSLLNLNFGKVKLASGGIVNNPGRGVAISSNVIAGEKGPEAILPLTDDTLQKLANMIPITVNLSNNMNGRVISREIIRTQNESNFGYNR